MIYCTTPPAIALWHTVLYCWKLLQTKTTDKKMASPRVRRTDDSQSGARLPAHCHGFCGQPRDGPAVQDSLASWLKFRPHNLKGVEKKCHRLDESAAKFCCICHKNEYKLVWRPVNGLHTPGSWNKTDIFV
jgi:hypothetical protein